MAGHRTLARLLVSTTLCALSLPALSDPIIYTMPGEREFSMGEYFSGGMVLENADQTAKRQAADQYLQACQAWRERLTASLGDKLIGLDCGVRVDAETPAPDNAGAPSVVYTSFSRGGLTVLVPEPMRVMVRTEEIRTPEELRCPAGDGICLDKARILARAGYDARCQEWKAEKAQVAAHRFIHAACASDGLPRFSMRDEADSVRRIFWTFVSVSSKGQVAQYFIGRDPIVVKDEPPQIHILNHIEPITKIFRSWGW